MARRKHRLLWIAGAGVAAYGAYRFLYKPWAAGQLADSSDLPGGSGYSTLPGGAAGSVLPGTLLPSPSAMIPTPATVGPIGFNSLGPQYGGVLGACIAKKGGTWSPEKCQARLNALVDAARTAKGQIAALKSGTANPHAGLLPALQARLAQTQAAMMAANANYTLNVAQGDTVGAAQWHAAALGHQSDVNDLNARIAAVSAPANNNSAISAYEGALAGYDNDYFNLTGVRLLGAI